MSLIHHLPWRKQEEAVPRRFFGSPVVHSGRQVNDSQDKLVEKPKRDSAEDRGLHSVSLGLVTRHISVGAPGPGLPLGHCHQAFLDFSSLSGILKKETVSPSGAWSVQSTIFSHWTLKKHSFLHFRHGETESAGISMIHGVGMEELGCGLRLV